MKQTAIIAAIFILSHGITTGAGFYAGYQKSKTKYEIREKNAYIAASVERDKADAVHRGNVAARDAKLADLVDRNASLNRLLQSERDRRDTATRSRPNDTYPDWFAGFTACHTEYVDLGKDAATWADRVNGLQGYIQAVQKINN